MNIAIILAGGSGTRAAQHDPASADSRPKQLWLLGGIPVWQYSWQCFASHPQIDHICLVWPEEYVEEIEQYVTQRGAQKPFSVIAGGKTRSDSSARALEFCRRDISLQVVKILIHDAARPLVQPRLIDESLAALEEYGAVVCALPARDSLFEQDRGQVSKVIDRSTVMYAQTPQSFRFEILKQAFDKHQKYREITATDDISVVKHYLPETAISVLRGEAANIKLTEALDLAMLEAYLKIQNN